MAVAMIIGAIENAHRFRPLHKGIALALDYFQQLKTPGVDRVDLDGENVYILFSEQQGKRMEDALLESHRRYIDIHFCLHGTELIGWRPAQRCINIVTPYDEKGDNMTYSDEPEMWSVLTRGLFAIYFPEDAHASMVSDGVVRKAVVKIAA